MADKWKNTVKLSALDKTVIDPQELIDENNILRCESSITRLCAFNNNGQCRFTAVADEAPIITQEDGCLCGIIMKL